MLKTTCLSSWLLTRSSIEMTDTVNNMKLSEADVKAALVATVKVLLVPLGMRIEGNKAVYKRTIDAAKDANFKSAVINEAANFKATETSKNANFELIKVSKDTTAANKAVHLELIVNSKTALQMSIEISNFACESILVATKATTFKPASVILTNATSLANLVYFQ